MEGENDDSANTGNDIHETFITFFNIARQGVLHFHRFHSN